MAEREWARQGRARNAWFSIVAHDRTPLARAGSSRLNPCKGEPQHG
jgi:hypothetical protein